MSTTADSALEMRMLERINDLLRALEEIAALKEFNGLFGPGMAQEALDHFDAGQSVGLLTRWRMERIKKSLVGPTVPKGSEGSFGI